MIRIAHVFIEGVLYVIQADPFYLRKGFCAREYMIENKNKRKVPENDRDAVVFGSNKNIDVLVDTTGKGLYSKEYITRAMLLEKFSEQDVDGFISNFKTLLNLVDREGMEENKGTVKHEQECVQFYVDFLAICYAFNNDIGAADFNLAGIGFVSVSFIKYPTPVQEGIWQLVSAKNYEEYGEYTPGMIKSLDKQ